MILVTISHTLHVHHLQTCSQEKNGSLPEELTSEQLHSLEVARTLFLDGINLSDVHNFTKGVNFHEGLAGHRHLLVKDSQPLTMQLLGTAYVFKFNLANTELNAIVNGTHPANVQLSSQINSRKDIYFAEFPKIIKTDQTVSLTGSWFIQAVMDIV